MSKLTIKNWNQTDKPREKLEKFGIKNITDAELLAIIINSGTKQKTALDLAKEILADNQNNLNNLLNKDLQYFTKFQGIGKAKAITIIAALELGKRSFFQKKQTQQITSSYDAFIIICPLLCNLNTENFYLITLTSSNKLINLHLISQGGFTKTNVDIKLIFKKAILDNAPKIIIAHNHPSGNLQPSSDDIYLTKQVQKAAEIFEISLLDHLIIAENSYFSFADNKLL